MADQGFPEGSDASGEVNNNINMGAPPAPAVQNPSVLDAVLKAHLESLVEAGIRKHQLAQSDAFPVDDFVPGGGGFLQRETKRKAEEAPPHTPSYKRAAGFGAVPSEPANSFAAVAPSREDFEARMLESATTLAPAAEPRKEYTHLKGVLNNRILQMAATGTTLPCSSCIARDTYCVLYNNLKALECAEREFSSGRPASAAMFLNSHLNLPLNEVSSLSLADLDQRMIAAMNSAKTILAASLAEQKANQGDGSLAGKAKKEKKLAFCKKCQQRHPHGEHVASK